jgi:hypothetical protein
LHHGRVEHLVEDDLAGVLDVAAVATDEPVDPQRPQVRVDLRAAAPGDQVDPMSALPRFGDGRSGAVGQLGPVVDQRSVDVE